MAEDANPLRRASDSIPPGVDPHLYIAIANGLKLDNLLREMKEVKDDQKEQGRVIISLQEQGTIGKANAAAQAIGEVKFTLRLLVGLVAIVPVVVGILTFTHYVYHWPS